MSVPSQMNRTVAGTYGKKIEQALVALGKELGVSITRGNGRFDAKSLSFKVTVTLPAADGSVETPETCAYNDMFRYDDDLKDGLNKIITYGGNQYKIVGAKPRSRKYPILVENINSTAKNNRFKLPIEGVRASLKLEALHSK